MAKEIVQMVRGLGLAMRLITSLVEEVKARGGYEEMLHSLTTERARGNLGKVADLIVTLDWRVPKSLIMKLARENSMKEWRDGEYAVFDTNFYWIPILKALDIPWSRFVTPEQKKTAEYDNDRDMLPELLDQLHGQAASAGMIVELEGDTYVVVGFDSYNTKDLKVGDILDKCLIGGVGLAPIEHIDIDN